MKKLTLIFLLVFLSISYVKAETYFSEVLFNPEGSDNNLEFIELFTDQDLSNYIIYDLSSSDILIKLKNSSNHVALIVEEDFDYENIDANIYSVGATIGNGLNNEEDVIILRNNEEIIDYLHYYGSWIEIEGDSICKTSRDSNWKNCVSSPGTENVMSTESNINLEISELMPNPEGDDDAPTPKGEWIELYNPSNEDVIIEQFYFKDFANHKLIISDLTSETIIKEKEYLIVYTNGFSGLLNNEGFEKIGLYDINNNLIDELSYSLTREGVSISKLGNSYILTKPSPGQENYKENEGIKSNVQIDNLYYGDDEVARFGETIRARINVYKGDSTKNEIKVYLNKDEEKLSLLTRFTVETKFYSTDVTIPVEIPDNCNGYYQSGDYEILAEGLGEEDSRRIKIAAQDGKECKKEVITKTVQNENQVTTPKAEDKSSKIENEEKLLYQSQGEKSKNLVPLFFSIIISLILVKFILKKD